MLSFANKPIMLSVVMLSVIRLNVVMLSVMAPPRGRFTREKVCCNLQSTSTSIPMFVVQVTDDSNISILPP
jgi:hypothetical protein